MCDHQLRGSRKVKVTILASEWGSSKGGLSTLNRELALQLAKFPEVEITFFLPQCSQEDKKVALQSNVKIVEAEPRLGFEQLEWLCFPPDLLQIDIIVGHGVKLGKQAQIIKKSKKCKWLQVVSTDLEELGMFKSYSNPISKGEEKHKTEVQLCKMADHVVGVGPKLSEALRSYLRSCKKDDTVLDFTPGVFEEFADLKQVPSEWQQRSVLVFGRGDVEDFELKGFDIAGKAVAALEDTRLVIVGAPDGKHYEITKWLTECGVPARCLRVRGFVNERERLKDLFQLVDLVIMPSRTEAFGLTGLEALSAGLPVLVSGNSGFGEALCSVPFGSRYVVNSVEPAVWTSAIKEILAKDRESRLEEAEVLRDSFDKKYNWARQTKDLIEKMISWVYVQNILLSLQDLQCYAGQVYNKTILSSNLRTVAEKKGFLVSDNQVSGNCLFYALSEQLKSVKGIQISHKELRNTLVQFLRENTNLLDGTSLFNFVSGYPSWREYLQSMAKEGTWGDHMVLFAAASYFQTAISIISSLDQIIVVHPEHAVADPTPLVLGHIHQLHYVSLQPRKGVKRPWSREPVEHELTYGVPFATRRRVQHQEEPYHNPEPDSAQVFRQLQPEESIQGELDAPDSAAGAVANVQVDEKLKRRLQDEGCFLDPEKYDPVKRLGKGGYAKVFLVIEKDTGQRMACKMFDLSSIMNDTKKTKKLVKSLKTEVNVLSSLKHEHIVKFFRMEEEQETAILLLEYMEGGTLTDWLKQGKPLQEPLVKKFTRQLLSAVNFLHTNGTRHVIHKDIKGANILLDKPRTNIKLADFGICTIMEQLRTETGQLTSNNEASFHWTSPELLGEEEFGRNTDIWSVGCTVIEMLTTKPPLFFENLTLDQKRFRIVHCQVHPPENCSPGASEFLQRCLRPRSERPSAAELLTDPFVVDQQQ